MLDHELDSADKFFGQFSLPDALQSDTPSVSGDRFIARRKLDFESGFNFDKKSIIMKQDALSCQDVPDK